MEWTWKSIGPDNFHISIVTLFLTFVTSVWISAARDPGSSFDVGGTKCDPFGL